MQLQRVCHGTLPWLILFSLDVALDLALWAVAMCLAAAAHALDMSVPVHSCLRYGS